MSRNNKKWKKRRRRREYRINPTVKDTHHLLYMGKNWRPGYLKILRDYYYCRVEIPKNTLHKMLHNVVKTVPTCSPENAKEVLNALRTLTRYGSISNEDRIEKRLVVLLALFDCIEPRTAYAIRKQLDLVWTFYSEKGP